MFNNIIFFNLYYKYLFLQQMKFNEAIQKLNLFNQNLLVIIIQLLLQITILN